jgi:hypothetical protein
MLSTKLGGLIDRPWARRVAEEIEGFSEGSCSIPDDHIDPRRSALFMARSILREVREGFGAC